MCSPFANVLRAYYDSCAYLVTNTFYVTRNATDRVTLITLVIYVS